MPLEELPVNAVLRNGRPSTSSRAGSDRAAKRDDLPKTFDTVTPSSIQSMLRLTTETGELGQFSIRPPRVPRSSTKGSLKRSDSYLTEEVLAQQNRILSPRRLRIQRIPNRRCGPGLSRQNTSTSRVTAYTGHSRGTSQVSFQTLQDLDRPPDSVPPNPTLLHHKSIGSLRNEHPRPRSPFAYPTRLRRPGYRSPSPAFSDRSTNQHVLQGRSSVRTASPSSLYSQRRVVPPGYYSAYNQSATSLLRSASPVLPGFHNGIRPSPFPSRAPTPLPRRAPTPSQSRALTPLPSPSPSLSLSSSVLVSSRLSAAPARIRSPSPSPLYYDYTEEFYDDENPYFQQTPSHFSVPLLASPIPEGGVLEHANDVAAPRTTTAELTTSDAATSHLLVHEHPTSSDSDRPPIEMFNDTVLAPPTNIVSSSKKADLDSSLAAPDPEENVERFSLTAIRRNSFPYRISLSTSSPQTCDLKSSSHFNSFSSSKLGEPADRDSSQRVSLMLPNSENVESDSSNAQGLWKLPSLDFSRLTLSSNSDSAEDPTRSSRTEMETNTNSIFAPVPERPSSSQSHHRRFSKILSIDDSLLELPEVYPIHDATLPNQLHTLDERLGQRVEQVGKHESFHFPVPPMQQRRLKGGVSLPSLVQRYSGVFESTDDKYLDIEIPKYGAGDDTNNDAEGGPLCVSRCIELDSQEILPESSTSTSEIQQINSPQSRTRIATGCYELDANTTAETFCQPLPRHNDNDHVERSQVPEGLPALLENGQQISVARPRPLLEALSEPAHLTSRQAVDSELREELGIDSRLNGQLLGESYAGATTLQTVRLTLRPSRESTMSPHGSRPWNIDENYPWMDSTQAVESTPPQSSVTTQEYNDEKPNLRERIKRRISSSHQPSNAVRKRLSISSDLSCLVSPRKSAKDVTEDTKAPAIPEISELMGNPIHPLNSSRGSMYRASQIGGGFPLTDQPSLIGISRQSAMTGMTDVKSYFSDDSSQMPYPGSLRKRLSNLRGKLPAHKPSLASLGIERESLNPVGALDPNQRREFEAEIRFADADTAETSGFQQSRRRMSERFRRWWQRYQAPFVIFGGRKSNQGGNDSVRRPMQRSS